MGRSMQEISRRIRGVSGTMQITRAMEMVSSVKLRQARKTLSMTKPYYQIVLDNIQRILSTVKGVRHPLLEERDIKTSLYITVASDRGLAGGYNANINRLVEGDLSEDIKVKIIPIGLKTYEFFRNRDYDIVQEFLGISQDPTFSDAKEIASIALDLYLKGEVDEIKVVYTEFESVISHKPKIVRLLPSSEIYEEPEEIVATSLMEFEPTPEEVLDFLIPKYVESTIYGALIEASTSEQGARQIAMESATENAEEIIEELELTYNRARQEAITMEITEIVSGADALK